MDFPKSVPSVGLVGGKFIDEDPLLGTPGSLIPSVWGNAVTLEILNVISSAGLAPDELDNTQLLLAIRNIIQGAKNGVLVDTGVAGAYTAANPWPLSALPATGYVQRVKIATANPGAATYAPDGLAAKPIYGLGLQPLQGGELPPGVAILVYLVQAGVNGGNGAWILVDSLGGALPIAPATKSLHAMQLGQAVGRLIGVQVFSTPGTFTYTQTPGTNCVEPLVQAAGGGGGGIQATGAGQVAAAFGGQAGAYGEGRFTSAFSGVTITVGAKGVGGVAGPNTGSNGGSSSFGGLLSCPGGVGGIGGTANAAGNSFGLPGPVSAAPSGANIRKVQGQGAGAPSVFSTGQSISGAGGSSFSGTGGQAFSAGAGVNATNAGSGGSGAAVGQSSGSSYKGGDGMDGYVVVLEYA